LSNISQYLFKSFWALSERIPYFKNFFRLLRFFPLHSTPHSWDILGIALEDYYSNALKSKFVYYQNCLQKEYNCKEWEFNLESYFRPLNKLSKLEKKLIDLSYGNILDIGSNTGYYIPYLMKRGATTGIEVSSKINTIARKRGVYCITGDIYSYKFKNKFDTVTLIGNDIALSGTLYRLKKLLKIFSALLNKNGQVLLIIRNIQTLKYWHVVYTPHYNGRFGTPFKLLFLNVHFFCKLANKYNFQFTLLGREGVPENLFYLVRLIKLPR